ncbi:MAG: hypothetical protein EFT35_05195 [Methanophagales archaeon ANME-1-THS]|nr:MAG: hypothetical protein EFT35_05195 [Methanophagales archaeon ANME-1-THS]
MTAKKIAACSILTGVLFLLFDMVSALLTSPLVSPYADLPIWKIPPNIVAGVIFDLINGVILVVVYITIYKGLPGLGWKKGLNYGIIVGLFRVVMTSFSSIVLYNVPLIVVTSSLITGYLEIVILCMILALLYEKTIARTQSGSERRFL